MHPETEERVVWELRMIRMRLGCILFLLAVPILLGLLALFMGVGR